MFLEAWMRRDNTLIHPSQKRHQNTKKLNPTLHSKVKMTWPGLWQRQHLLQIFRASMQIASEWESSGEFSNGLYQDRKHFCIFCAALNATVEHNATGQGIDEANSPKNLANASTTVGSLSWHLIHESMSSVHLASSCYLLRCFLKSYGILGSLQRKEQKTRPCGPVALWPCGPVALPAWQWSCSPSFGPHTSAEPGQASFAAFVLHAELRSYNTIQYHQIPQARGAPIYAELTESLLSARTWKECCPMLPPACNRFHVRTPRSKSGSDAMLKHQQSRLLSKAASKWHLQVATATALPATRSTHHFHTNSPVVYGSMSLLFSQATECRQLPQLMSCKWQSSPHRANWSHDQNGRRHVRLSNCRKYEMWTHVSVKIIWSPPILKVPKTHEIFRFVSYSWNFFRFEVESMCQKIWECPRTNPISGLWITDQKLQTICLFLIDLRKKDNETIAHQWVKILF